MKEKNFKNSPKKSKILYTVDLKLFVQGILPLTQVYVPYRAYNMPLLIKPSLQPNSNKPPLICPKSPLFEAFWGKIQKISIKHRQKPLKFFINRLGLYAQIL